MAEWIILDAILVTITNLTRMQLICPECKNEVDLSLYPQLAVDQVIECQMCGISLVVTKMEDEVVEAEIVDEGK